MFVRGRRTICLAVSAAFLTTLAAHGARAEFPEQPVTINVGFGAGGGVDAISRVAARILSEELGESVIVENQPGAGGAVAVTRLKAAPPDGHTLASTTSTTLTFDPHTGNVAFGLDDFEYLAAFGSFPEALIALPSKGWADLSEMLDEAKASGRSLTYASNTAIDRMITSVIAEQSGVTINPVPVDGGAESVAQTLGGHVDFGYSSGTYYPQAVSGDLQIIAGLGDERVPGFEDVPTLQDLGFDVASVNLVLFLAPKGLDEEAREKLLAAFEVVGDHPDMLALLEQRNMGTFASTGDELTEQLMRHSSQFESLAASAE